ncbi:hypothetical protein [Gordonia sputi]|nr:hypothetical protein [Gordonia sputi]
MPAKIDTTSPAMISTAIWIRASRLSGGIFPDLPNEQSAPG